MKSVSLPVASASRRLLSIAAIAAALPLVPAAYAATTISWANPANVTSSAVSSSASSTDINVPAGTWAVGDAIYFSGTSATTNPFSTTATRYYVVYASGSTIRVSTTPGGAALSATNTTTASAITQGVDWFTSTNWTGGTVPNSSSTIASFGNNTNSGANVPVVVNGSATVYGLTFGGSANGDLLLTSGANGTGLYSLTFATDDSSSPKMTLSGGSNSLIFLGSSSNGAMKLNIAGTQGLIINSSAGGAITGSGVSATSTAPGKQIRSTNVDWSGLSGGIQVERGLFQVQASTGVLTGQNLTVGNAQTVTNNLLAGFSLQGFGSTVGTLNGNSLGRVYGASTLTVGAGNATGGNYAGVIGKDFTGGLTATVVTKTGTGTQTFSGVIGGTGAVNVNAGTVVYDGATISTTGNTTVASGATLGIANTVTTGTTTAAGRIMISSGGTLTGSGTLVLADTNTFATGVSMAGTFAPGTNGTIGTFTLNSSAGSRSGWAFETNGVLAFDLGAGVTSDKMAIIGRTGTDVFFNNSVITFTDLTSGSLTTGDYLLFDGDANTDFGQLTLGSAFTGASVSGTAITAGLTIGTGLSGYTSSQLFLVGNDIYVNVTAAAIPEPSTFAALAGLGVLGLAAFRRRRAA